MPLSTKQAAVAKVTIFIVLLLHMSVLAISACLDFGCLGLLTGGLKHVSDLRLAR